MSRADEGEGRDPGQIAYEVRFADARPREMVPWAEQPDDVKAVWARVEQASISAALVHIGDLARRVGEAEGALRMSEKAGIIDGWIARAAQAEAEVARLRERVATLEAALKPFCFGDAAMEQILFGSTPDSASCNFTIKYGHLRAARTALEAPHADK